METAKKVTVETTINASIEKVWELWTEPTHIKQWNSPSEDWHTTIAENDLRVGGEFCSRMEAKDGSFGFDFAGTYDEVEKNQVIAYTLGDGRKVNITFKGDANQTNVIETFDAELTNPVEYQQQGWQAILENFKKYAEETNK